MMKFILLIAINLISNLLISQVAKFAKKPDSKIKGDSISFTLQSTEGYNYFSNSFDKSFVYTLDSLAYDIEETTSTKTGDGYYKISYKGKIIQYYEIRNKELTGIALCYFKNKPSIFYMCEFKKGMKQGLCINFTYDLLVDNISFFKKGKFKKYTYVRNKSRKSLRKINKYAKGPFSPIIHYSYE